MSAAPTAAQVALQWCQLQPSDLDTMEALHRLSCAGMSAQLVKPEKREFLASLLHGRGQVLGAWAGTQLVAYGILQNAMLPEDNPRPLLGLAPECRLAKLAGAAVAPRWRGQGLQRALIAQRMARADSRAVLYVTAAPGNYPSWSNLLACGFAVRALQMCYGGFPRYLLAYDPAATPIPASAAGANDFLDIDSLDLAQQQRLLQAGWQGVAPGSAGGSLRWVPGARA
ncbi:MAG: GNAT family N-acetyltransferase [Giesbergeria sp.]|nr:GNAT family N-acetyltransferase [Giesbergeria sp.]